ncbi:MAG: DUF3084 domain-containing protein [Armatimonadetes bacterium]|nr:DUF3084 domain-containing protein [Armatimonadota bacterium]
MDISSLKFIVVFMVMGGVVAYLGDRLGRKLGKKRLRLGGLRPRHTATAVTVFVGMLIPVITTYGIVTTSKEAREVFAEGTRLVSERDRLTAEVGSKLTQISSLNLTRSQLESTIERRETEIERLMTDTVLLARQAQEAEQKLVRVNKLVEEAVREREKVESQREDALQRLAEAQDELVDAQERIGALQQRITGLEEQEQILNGRVDDLTEQFVQAQALAAEAERGKRQAEAELQRLRDTLLQLRETESNLRRTIGNMWQGVQAVRTSQLLFQRGEELARTTLQGGISPQEARVRLTALVRVANVSALERGVIPNEQGTAAAMQERVRPLPDGTVIRIPVDAQADSIVDAIGRTTQDLVMIATSFYNYFDQEKDPVPLDVGVFFNRVVYEKGDTVASMIIDGALSEDDVLNEIMAFLTAHVRDSAAAHGMIPVHGRPESLGRITFAEITRLIEQIRSHGGLVIVEAVAAQKTKSAEPLTLEFRIRQRHENGSRN